MTDNIALLNASLVDQRLYQLRNEAVRKAVADIKAGCPSDALARMTASVLGEQARVAGIRVMPSEPA